VPGAPVIDTLLDAGLARLGEAGPEVNGEAIRRAILIASEAIAERDADLDTTWLERLVAGGETESVEFKQSVKWDVRRGTEEDQLKYEIPRAIAAFANSAGGSLLLGVADDATVVGLEHDMQLIKRRPTLDGVTLLVSNLLRDTIGGDAAREVRFASGVLDGRSVLVLTVEPAVEPVFVSAAGQVRFYVRVGPTTVELNVRETVAYVRRHWPESGAR
jgi:predicted HTH transcriptional regulator